MLISDILSSPQPAFTPKKGILDSDEDIERMKKDNAAAFYRSKLRALISGKKDPSTGYAGTFGNRPGGTPVQFGIVRTPRNSPSSYEHLAAHKNSGIVIMSYCRLIVEVTAKRTVRITVPCLKQSVKKLCMILCITT